jgi:uncharacterized protein HemY
MTGFEKDNATNLKKIADSILEIAKQKPRLYTFSGEMIEYMIDVSFIKSTEYLKASKKLKISFKDDTFDTYVLDQAGYEDFIRTWKGTK